MKPRTIKVVKEIIIALSLANLCFFEKWAVLLKSSNYHFLGSILLQNKYLIPPLLPLILTVLFFAAVFFGSLALARYSRRAWVMKFARLAFLGIFIVFLNRIRVASTQLSVNDLIAQYGRLFFVIVLVGGVSAAFLIYRWKIQIIRITTGIVLILSPFILVTFSQAAWLLVKEEIIIPQKILAKPVPVYIEEAPKVRVLWLIFDEMDQRIAFTGRPSGLELPELDRLRDQSLYATDAYAPAFDTAPSMSSYLTGQQIKGIEPVDSSELLITLRTGETVRLSDQPSIFSQALDAGYNTAVAGCGYHPYCRLFGDSIITCSRHLPRENLEEYSYGEMIKSIAEQVYYLQPWWKYLPESLKELFVFEDSFGIATFQRTLENAKEFAQDPALGLIFVHFPVPHSPCIYSRLESDFVVGGKQPGCYLDNLAAADIALGELRSAMESAGVWENTVVILSSDHYWRMSNEFDGKVNLRIPFLLKLPNQKEKVVYKNSFNTILTHDLVLALLSGTILNSQSIMNWLDQRRQDYPLFNELYFDRNSQGKSLKY